MYIHAKRFFVFIGIVFILVGGHNNVILKNSFANGDDTMCKKDNLITLAKEIAIKEKIDVENSDIKIVTEDKFTIVEFHPKNTNQFGGGGKLFFIKEKGEYKFLKIELWQ